MFLCTGAETTDGFLLDLTHTLTGKTKLCTYLLERHLRLVDAVEGFYHTTFTIVENLERIIDLCLQRVHQEHTIGHRCIVVDKHIQQAVVLAIDKGSINGYMAGVNAHGFIDLLFRQV